MLECSNALRPVPSPVNARAILDTGAEITCLDTGLILTLGLPTAGTVLRVNVNARQHSYCGMAVGLLDINSVNRGSFLKVANS